MAPLGAAAGPKRLKLELKKTTIRTLRRVDLEQVVGGTIVCMCVTHTACSAYCCPTEPPRVTCGPECGPPTPG
jgi:hypothetical protein